MLLTRLLSLCAVLASPAFAQTASHTLTVAPGKNVTLTLPREFDIQVAATGLKRVRFMAQAPDGRVFATSMYNLADNTRGAVYILDGWEAKAGKFTRVTKYLDGLRNPNNLAFWTDGATGQTWLYLPLTDRLVRYSYSPGDLHPRGAAQTLIRFPDYGLNYKYGGWHLTRTVAIANLQGGAHVYVAVGSSCNYCHEREVARATVIRMNPDGSDQHVLAYGLRNAVDLRFVPDIDGGALFASNMGDDHLGDKLPEDTLFELASNRGEHAQSGPDNYGWPTCYFGNGKPVHDVTPLPEMPPPGDLSTESERPVKAGPASHEASVYGMQDKSIAAAGTNLAAGGGHAKVADPNANLGPVPAPLSSCEHVPAAYTVFAAHSSPLGLAYFGAGDSALQQSFLVALHGAGHPRIGTGYRVVRFSRDDRGPRDFITGFLTVDKAGQPQVHGRPCGLLRVGPDSFLLTDDFLGAVYYVHLSAS